MTWTVQFTGLAEDDVDEAYAWYARSRRGLGEDFLADTERALPADAATVRPGDSRIGVASRPRFFADVVTPEEDGPFLVVGGGQAFRVRRRALVRLATGYWLQPIGVVAGGPPEDPWSAALLLPPDAREDIRFFFLLGRQDATSASMPYGAGAALAVLRCDSD